MPFDAKRPLEHAREVFAAYENKNRRALENLVAGNFRFTSPYDDHIDRDEYFKRCWPNSERIRDFRFIDVAETDNGVFVLYQCTLLSGTAFRNCEHLVFKDGKLASVEVFFGDPPSGVTKSDYPRFVETAQAAWRQARH
jgi:ketosteroid isomerase-like protein